MSGSIWNSRTEHKYDWVSVKDDMPPDDPNNPGQSIVVNVKCFGLSWSYHKAYYVEAIDKWCIDKTGNIIGGKRSKTIYRPEVLFWRSE